MKLVTLQKVMTDLMTIKLCHHYLPKKKRIQWILEMSQIVTLYLHKCCKTFVMEVSLIQEVNRREARYKIRDCIKKIQSEWKGSLKDTLNMGKG